MIDEGSGPSVLVGPADLVRALAGVDESDWSQVAGFLGYDLREVEREPSGSATPSGEAKHEQRRPPPLPPPDPRPPLRCWRVDHVEFGPYVDEVPSERPLGAGLRADQIGRHPQDAKPIAVPALAAWPSLRGAIEQLVRRARPLGEVDVDSLVDTMSRGDPIRRVPRRPRRVQGPRVVVIVDRSDRLLPCWTDQDLVVAAMQRELGGIEVVRWPEGLEGCPRDDEVLGLVEPSLARDDVVLVLGDLGLLGDASEVEAWRRVGEALHELGVRLGALVPCPRERWPDALARVWSAVAWADPDHARAPTREAPEVRRDRLWALLSWTIRLEASLLRAARAALPSTLADEGSEADLWNHPDAWVIGYELVVSDALRRKGWADLQAMMREESFQPAILAVIEAVREHHAGRARETLTEELRMLELLDPEGGWITPAERTRVYEFTQGVLATLSGEDGEVDVDELAEWTQRSTSERLPASTHPELVPMILQAGKRAGLVRAPRGYWEGQVPPPPGLLRKWDVWQVHDDLVIRPEGTPAPARGSLVVTMLARVGRIGVDGRDVELHDERGGELELPDADAFELSSDCVRHRVCRETRPDWAHAFGRDAFGLWATLRVGQAEQRMRWIVPGRFMMGSPDSEVGRDDDEGPQHRVTIEKGLWLADTPCTQAFWVAVMGSNPSRFQSPRRPVEQVSWEDVQTFIAQLRERFGSLDTGLPSEACWEYACRAGTTTATYAGDLELRGEHDAPVLDAIAWYGGNSGRHGFDLKDGWDSSDWPNKQYPHRRAATREVATRRANGWGLYDMLGNVWEWCEERYRPYEAAPVADPRPRGIGQQRVVRGGSWLDHARYVRAAFRLADVPGFRDESLGFRLAGGQGIAPSPESGERSDPRAGSREAREPSKGEDGVPTGGSRRSTKDRS